MNKPKEYIDLFFLWQGESKGGVFDTDIHSFTVPSALGVSEANSR